MECSSIAIQKLADDQVNPSAVAARKSITSLIVLQKKLDSGVIVFNAKNVLSITGLNNDPYSTTTKRLHHLLISTMYD